MKHFYFVIALCAMVIVGIAQPQVFAQNMSVIQGTVSSDNTPIAGASVRVVGSRKGAITKKNGKYSLQVQAGEYTLQISCVGFKTIVQTVDASNGSTITRDFSLSEDIIGLSKVVVVGSRADERTVVSSSAPIDVLTAADIKQTGLTETGQVLQLLAPSFNFPRPAINDGTDHVRPATLRGLSADQTLVLINGKRRHTSAMLNVNSTVGRGASAVDLNAIPTSSIERIEILRDGASAQYGSDAIAGVINIILKSNDKLTASLTGGQTSEGDGKTLTGSASYGVEIGETGYVNLSAEYRDRGMTNRAGLDTRQQYFDGDPRNANPPKVTIRYGDPKTKDGGAFLNALIPLSTGISAYAFGGYTSRNGESSGFFRRPNDERNVRALYPNGFLPLINSSITDASIVGGLKADISGWQLDASGAFGSNSFRFDITNSLNTSYGTASPRDFYAGTVKFQQMTANVDIFKPLDIGLHAPVNFAAGFEYRSDNYIQQAGEEKSYKNGGVPVLDGPDSGSVAAVGSQVFPGYRPEDEADTKRSNISLYVDVENNLTKDLLLGLAGRFENYSDFGSAVNGKLSARYSFAPEFSVRGTASTGFRAPSVMQQYFSSTATDFIGGQPIEIRTFPVSSVQARALGAQDLKPEKSVNISLGVGIEPAENFAVSIDGYMITIADRVTLSENFQGPQIEKLLKPFNYAAGRFFTNAIDTRTTGLDIVARYGFDFHESGNLRLTASANFTKTEVTRVAEPPSQLVGLGETLFGSLERARVEQGQPRSTFNFSANYTINNLSVMAREVRYGSVFEPYNGGIPEYDQTFAAKFITDLDISYRVMSNIRVAVGGNNIFNVYPDKYKIVPDDDYNGLLMPYSAYSPFGFNGAYYYVRASVEW
jgi:iron complex outermembrane receptor protein